MRFPHETSLRQSLVVLLIALLAAHEAPAAEDLQSGLIRWTRENQQVAPISWDAKSGKRIQTLKNGGNVYSVAFSPDGRYVLTGSSDNTAVIWDAKSGKRIQTLKHANSVYSVAFSPDGRYVLTGSWDNTAGIWDAKSGKRIQTLKHANSVYSVAFSPDGLWVLTGSGDNTAVIWDAKSGKRIQTLKHAAWVYSVAFSPDGRYVLTGSSDNTAVIWDAKSGKRLQTLKHGVSVIAVAFSPDGLSVLTGSASGSVVIWSTSSWNRSFPLVQERANRAMNQTLEGLRLLPESFGKEKSRLQSRKPSTPPELVKDEFEPTSAFEDRVGRARADYERRVAEYNQDVADLERRIEAFYAAAPRSLTSSQRNQSIAEAFLEVFGKPQLHNARYDADAATFFIDLTSNNGADDFQRTLAVAVPIAQAREFKGKLSKARPEVSFRISENGSIAWESAVIQHLGTTYAATPIDEVDFEVVEMSAPIAAAELRTLEPDMPQPIQAGEIQVSLEVDPEIAAMQQRIYELRTRKKSDEARARKKAQMTKEISQLEREITERRTELKRTKFDDDLPGRLQKASRVPPDRHRYLLAVGIHDYDEVTDVPFADRSADLFRQAARQLLGVPKENTEFLSERSATGTRISSRLSRLLNRVGPSDTVYFYYAGHGVPSRDGKSNYLLPVDGDAGSYQDDSRMGLNAIYRRLADSKAGRIVSFIDACFSGQAGPGELVFEGVAPLLLVSNSGVPDPERMTVLAAGKSDQFSNQYAERGHRLFTYFLIDGLLAGHTQVDALARHVREKVNRESRRFGTSYTQEPQLYGNTRIDLAR
jgi:DNA-binding beta-propeller fold protein YncE